ncbi:MAG TPA: cell wall hydrolase [Allosphingosinicella sp.]|nr:cell wall hydrolase [Allosphingosinicella sp.]
MNRITRAAGFAAAVVALVAAASYSEPASAVDRTPMVAADAASVALPAPAKADMSEPNAFAKMWSAVSALVTPGPAAAQSAAPARRNLDELVAAYEGTSVADREQECLAKAVYFEARGESIEGQLAVAEVVMNRAASGRYPTTLCAVITQKAQFSFIRNGRFPEANRASDAWRRAVAISQIARAKLVASLPSDVLWYHATYVSPKWGKRLTRQSQIGLHIFYS